MSSNIKGNDITLKQEQKKYTIGVFKKKVYEIDHWIEVVGESYEDAYQKLMNEPLFNNEALKDILDKIEWLES